MCGRATYKLTWEEIVALYRLLDHPTVFHLFEPNQHILPYLPWFPHLGEVDAKNFHRCRRGNSRGYIAQLCR
jgi:hypothetical protein